MEPTVKSLSVVIDQINESNTFTNGDCVSGRVILEVAKEAHIQSFFIKVKGKASVLWSETYSRYSTVVYHDKETCFRSLLYFVQEQKKQGQDGSSLLTNEAGQSYSRVVPRGIHIYPFTFQLPHQDLPASFKGDHGKVVYFLEAKLCRSMRIPSKAKVTFNYLPKGDMSTPDQMMPQYGIIEKKMKFLTSGSVAMSIYTEKMAYHLGEGLMVRADIENNSSRPVKPKFCLYQKQSFFAMKKRKVCTKSLLKVEGDCIESATTRSVTKVLNIPADTCVSILNCRVLKVEYRLKVYLDVKFASDPKVKLPVVLCSVPMPKKSGAVAPVDVHAGLEPWTRNQAGWNKFSAPPAYGTIHGRYPPLPEIKKK